jgi:hypothetical protein
MTDFRLQLISLLKLAVADMEHGNDSSEADTVRDQMDGSWERLTPKQRIVLRQLSAFINDLEEHEEFRSVDY